jgi:hypothetical protein
VTTPSPVPTPLPTVPNPQGTITVNLPPDVIQRLTGPPPDHGWWYDSAANLIGSGVAIITAGATSGLASSMQSPTLQQSSPLIRSLRIS